MVLAGSSCQWSEVVELRAGSNASGRPQALADERERKRERLLLLLEAFTAPHSPAKHMTSHPCCRLHMCVFACQRDTLSIMRGKTSDCWELERGRERKGIYRCQCSADRDVFHHGLERKIIRGQTFSTCPLHPSPQATSGPPSPLSLHFYLLVSF